MTTLARFVSDLFKAAEWETQLDWKGLVRELREAVDATDREVGVVWRRNSARQKWKRGDEAEVYLTATSAAETTFHTHPRSLYPDSAYHPPTGFDVRCFVCKCARFPGEPVAPDYIVEKAGVWCLRALTRGARTEAEKQLKPSGTGEPLIDQGRGADLLEAFQENANNEGRDLLDGKRTLDQYVDRMRTLVADDMGVVITFAPWERAGGTFSAARKRVSENSKKRLKRRKTSRH